MWYQVNGSTWLYMLHVISQISAYLKFVRVCVFILFSKRSTMA